MDLVSKIIAFESGELDDDGTVALFQELTDSGAVWLLQGFYGRTARDLIRRGLVTQKTGNGSEKKTWTVIGFWYNDEPVVTGVVEGGHPVYGGNTGELGDTSFQGEWATSVKAESAEEAETLAVEEMLDGER
jgi:hypothetical protein